ncbi:MAG: hypothetical protein ACYS8Z_15555 [Planctomycetota bacterium]|jgi:hypothetical protein
MARQNEREGFQNLPPSAVVFIERVIKKMRWCRRAREEVRTELIAHFENGLEDFASDEEKEQEALRMIAKFGEIKLLALLLRRAKKRCRPLWQKVVFRSLKTVGVLFVTLILYTIWFTAGKAVIDVDYTALLNSMNRPEIRDEDNAWPHYEQAGSLFAEPNGVEFGKLTARVEGRGEQLRFADLSEDERHKIAEWVELNGPAWRAFETAAAKSYCYREYAHDPNAEERWLLSIQLPHLVDIRNLARAGIWRSRMAADQGRLEEALGDCIAVARAGSHWQARATLIEHLVGIAVGRMACHQIIIILEDHTVAPDLLERCYRQLSVIDQNNFTFVNIEGERFCFMDTVQRVFTKGGLGGGHLIPSAWKLIANDQIYSLEGQDRILFMPYYAAESMLHARRDETVAKANELYARHKELAEMTPYQRRVEEVESAERIIDSLPRRRYFLLHYMAPAIDRVAVIGFRGKALHQATLTILTLKRREAEEGQYPDRLNELVAAGFLDELPMDPYSDKPLVYKKTDGNFILYSFGPNFEDDKGTPGTTEKGTLRDWADNGDTVFWPPPRGGTAN